jgi:molybdopterin molybdotransferase
MARELGHDLLPLEAVREMILSLLSPLEAVETPLASAHGCVLREDLRAAEPVPPFDNSAMDGYAVRAADLETASPETPVTLMTAGVLAAGAARAAAVEPGRTVRIMTGAPIPPGADAVVPHELTRFDAEKAVFSAPVKPGQNIRRAGGDVAPGDVPLRSGAVLRPSGIALAAALGRARFRVTRAPRVAIISPGDELVAPGEPCGPGKVRSSNAPAIAAALRDLGCEPDDRGILPDSEDAIRSAIAAALSSGADAIISTGGVSAGDRDYVQAVVRGSARPGHVFKVAMRPGKPQVFGLFDGKPLFGLPGNPASALISFEVFVRPALRRLRGEAEVLDVPFGARFPFEYRYRGGRAFLLRARVEPEGGGEAGFRVVQPGKQDSSFLSSLAAANALIRLPAERDKVEAGEVHPAVWIGGRP